MPSAPSASAMAWPTRWPAPVTSARLPRSGTGAPSVMAPAYNVNVTFAGQLPGEGKEALLSVETRQSTASSPSSLGGVTLAESTEPSVATYMVASYEPLALLHEASLLEILSSPLPR